MPPFTQKRSRGQNHSKIPSTKTRFVFVCLILSLFSFVFALCMVGATLKVDHKSGEVFGGNLRSVKPSEKKPTSNIEPRQIKLSHPGCQRDLSAENSVHMVPPPAGPVSVVCGDTSEGPLSIAVHHAWAPIGAQRFMDMVRDGFFGGNPGVSLFRALKAFLVQFGLHGDLVRLGRRSLREMLEIRRVLAARWCRAGFNFGPCLPRARMELPERGRSPTICGSLIRIGCVRVPAGTTRSAGGTRPRWRRGSRSTRTRRRGSG